jgi:predicted secreted protein
MISDGRSNKVAIVCHCIVNTNAKALNLPTTKIFPFMANEVIESLKKNSTSIVQMPCPEQMFFGFSRKGDWMNKESMDSYEFRKHCSEIAKKAVSIINEYIKNEFAVKCVIGSKRSPSCGVTKTITAKGIKDDYGILMEEVKKELKTRKIEIPFIDVDLEKENMINRDIENLEKLLR